jgi:hypothetical protein
MSESLYRRLYKYAKASEHASRENYLTEAFAHLLQQLCQHDHVAAGLFLFDVLLAKSRRTNDSSSKACLARLRTRLGAAIEKVRWVTQKRYRTTGGSGQPDVELYDSGGKLALSIEIKISASHHDQLQRFGARLAESNPGLNPACALVFLTGTTPAPSNFLNANALSDYSVPLRSICSWASVHNWMRSVTLADQFSAGLVGEFSRFLEEERLTHMDQNDTKALEGFLSADVYRKLAPFLKEVRSQIKAIMPSVYEFRGSTDCFAYSNGSYIWDWCYRDKRLGWFVAWGLAVGDEDESWGRSLPKSLQALVAIASEQEKQPLPFGRFSATEKTKWQQWSLIEFGSTQAQALQYTDANALATKPEGFIAAFISWLRPLLLESDKIFNRCLELRDKGRR